MLRSRGQGFSGAAQPCSTRRAKALEDWCSLLQPRIRINLSRRRGTSWSPTHGIAECVRGRRGRRPSGVEVGAGSGAAVSPSLDTHFGEGNVLGPSSGLFPLTPSSPSGRGKSLVRSRAIRAALDPVPPSGSEGESGDRTTRMHESSEGGRRVSLSLGERAGVRGNVVPAHPRCTIALGCVSGAGSRCSTLPQCGTSRARRRPQHGRPPQGTSAQGLEHT